LIRVLQRKEMQRYIGSPDAAQKKKKTPCCGSTIVPEDTTTSLHTNSPQAIGVPPKVGAQLRSSVGRSASRQLGRVRRRQLETISPAKMKTLDLSSQILHLYTFRRTGNS